MKVDLESVDPKGRLDVLLYKLAGHFVGHLESKNGVSGVWDNIKPMVSNVLQDHVTPIELPQEARILFGILQANYQKQIEGDLK